MSDRESMLLARLATEENRSKAAEARCKRLEGALEEEGLSGDWQPTHRHYKGGLYRVLHIDATHSETLETLTVYEGENGGIWCRPKEMFYGNIDYGTKRFTPLPETGTALPIEDSSDGGGE